MTQTIEQPQAKIAELEAEVERLKRTNSSYANLTKAQGSQLTNLRQRLYQLKGADSAIDSERQANCDLTEQLAAEQLNNKRLRDALIATRNDLELRMRLTEDDSLNISNSVLDQMLDAIDITASTEALDKYVAEKVKEATLPVADELQKTRLQMITDFGQYQESHEQVATLTKQRDLAVETLHYCVKQVPELATVPGIATAIKESEGK